MNLKHALFGLGLALVTAASVNAQSTEVAFGGLQHDSSLPVEIASDQLQVSQSEGTATFIGNVIIGQGEMRISAAKAVVFYETAEGEPTGEVSSMLATGGVTVVNGNEAAEADQADYSVADETILMTGNVILTQGRNAISAETMLIDLNKGTAALDGRVRTILQTGGNN